MSEKTNKIKRYILFKDISIGELISELLEYRFKKYKEISIEIPFKNFKGIEITIKE